MDEPATARTRLRSFSPVFPVRDLRRALAHYASLGFDVQPYTEGDGYGFADRDRVSLHLSLDTGHEHESGGDEGHDHEHVGTAYLYVADADALYDEWTRPGVGGLTRRVGDTPYELREGSHVDPDGNLIRFGSPMPSQTAERLRLHLEARYGIDVTAMTDLDVGVWRVGRADGPDWVARWFPARRPAEAVAGDASILRYVAAREFPAERCAAEEPVSTLDGRAVLVTEWAGPVPRRERREAIRGAGGLGGLGALLGRLHALPPGVGPVARPGGAWHHLADGLPAAEARRRRGCWRASPTSSPTTSARPTRRCRPRSTRSTPPTGCRRRSPTPTSCSRTWSRPPAAWSWSTGPGRAAAPGPGRWRSCSTPRGPRTCAGSTWCWPGTAGT